MLAFQVPRIERLALRNQGALLRRGLETSGMPDSSLDQVFDRMSQPGALTAGLNWYRAVLLGGEQTIGSVSVPTTHVWSTEDVALDRVGAELTARHASGPYKLEILDGISHWIPEEVPERAAEIILARMRGTA